MVNISDINMDNITLADCIELYEYKNIRVVINDGKIIGFEEE